MNIGIISVVVIIMRRDSCKYLCAICSQFFNLKKTIQKKLTKEIDFLISDTLIERRTDYFNNRSSKFHLKNYY